MHVIKLKHLALAASLLALAGCGTVYAVPPEASMNAPQIISHSIVYKVRTGDTLKLTVYGEDSLTGQYTVDRNGVITIPMIGEVPAAGFSKDEMQNKIGSMLVSGGYLAKPIVTIDVLTMSPIYVMGEVKTPGAYPYQPSLDVFKAIALAGGYTPRAAKNLILLDRVDSGMKKHMNANEDTPLLPGDSITIRERIF